MGSLVFCGTACGGVTFYFWSCHHFLRVADCLCGLDCLGWSGWLVELVGWWIRKWVGWVGWVAGWLVGWLVGGLLATAAAAAGCWLLVAF